MRIDRIRLKDFCGVSAAEVRFAPTGVTIVHGPNEAGKSTLMQGISVLFDYLDDSRKEEVRNTKPVNRDVGSEVETDIQIGAYRFTYFKRFHKNRETRLTVHAPAPENLSGREAHERVRAILESSVDTALWRALRIIQGRNLVMPDLQNQPALAQALDRAAGQAKSGDKEEALFDAAYAEYAQYYTDTGREKDNPLGQAHKHATDSAEAVRALEVQVREVEDDVARFANLERSAAMHRRSIAGLELAKKSAQENWNAVSKLKEGLERAMTAHQLADQAMQAAKSAVERRRELVSALSNAATGVEVATAQHARTAESVATATQSLEAARAARDAAAANASRCEGALRIRASDLELRKEEFDLVLMAERLEHVRKADADAVAASAVVAATRITDALRNKIRDAEIELKTKQAVLDAAAPQISIHALKAQSVSLNNSRQELRAGERRDMAVTEPLSMAIADLMELRFNPGNSAENLQQAVLEAEATLARACAKAGVLNPAQAESAWAALQEAKRVIAARDRVIREHLRDLTRDALNQRVEVTRAKVHAYLAGRVSDIPLPASADAAAPLHVAANAAAATARSAVKGAEAALGLVQASHAESREQHAANVARLGAAKEDHTRTLERLESVRNVSSDAALHKLFDTADITRKSALGDLESAQRAVGSADPETTKAILDTSSSALERALEAHDQTERERIALRAKLDVIGDKGLAEALSEAERVAFEADDALARLRRRAGAARMLYETLRSEQESMRKAYVAPLREGIERLGRHVFGPSLQVEVDDTLTVVRRTIEGVTVAIEQLSTGAKEQMGLLVRLAAASMVSQEGGVPLVLDDALGSTDQGRIEALGAVLRIASRNSQTIILTCAPERYAHVGAAASTEMT